MTVVRWILAALSIVIGIAGLLLPILPGWLFLGIAALLIFPETQLAQKSLAKVEQRFPKLARGLRRLVRRRAAGE